MSDVYSGYGKAVRKTNELRREQKLPELISIYCNAHARRKFKESEAAFPEESNYFLEQYGEIYRLEKEAKENPPEYILYAESFNS